MLQDLGKGIYFTGTISLAKTIVLQSVHFWTGRQTRNRQIDLPIFHQLKKVLHTLLAFTMTSFPELLWQLLLHTADHSHC